MPWSQPGGPDAGDDPRHPGHLGLLERRHQARLPGRLLHPHADDARSSTPGPTRTATPKVFLAGVGELMTEVAGEVCDGFLCHGFTTERYLREVTLPALERGLAQGGRARCRTSRSPARRSWSPAPTRRRWPLGRGHAGSRSRSTARRPPTAAVLELHGWGDLQDELNAHVQGGQVGRDGRAHRRRDPATPSPWSPSPSSSRPGSRRATATSSHRISFYAPYASRPRHAGVPVHGGALPAGT